MRKACAVAVAGLAACAAAVMSPAVGRAAATTDDGDLWIINAAGQPIGVVLDDHAVTAALPRLANLRRPLAAGGHGVAVLAGGQVVSAWEVLDVHNVALNPRGRPAWCELASRDAKGRVRLQLLEPTPCRTLIGAGPTETHADAAPP